MLRLFVHDVSKTKEVEIGREIFTPLEGFNTSEIYQEASYVDVTWLSTVTSLPRYSGVHRPCGNRTNGRPSARSAPDMGWHL
jgi:hypothetical protein